MKVGDYVRTIDGIIAKIIDVQENPYKEKTIYVLDKEIYIKDLEMSDEYLMLNPFAKETTNKIDTHFGDEKIIIKSSTSIMNLIEENDYIRTINDTDFRRVYMSYGKLVIEKHGLELSIKKLKLAEIITSQQFSQMKYKVESEVN